MAVNIIMEKSTFTGRDSSGKGHYRAVLLADTTDELPTREWNGIVLDQGSSITSIGEGAEYLMNSAGAWVRQGGGAPEPTLIEKSITANGEYDPADDDADGYSSVSVSVSPTLENKSVTPTTSEQTITAGENYDGLGTVTVEAVTAAIDSDIVAGNIKKNVEILGVTGSYEGDSEFIKGSSGSFSVQDSIKKITIPAGYTAFNGSPFYGASSLEDVTLPETFYALGTDCFRNCTKLKNINIPNRLTILGSNAFAGCASLTGIDMPDTVTSIGDGAFYGTGLTSIEIPSSVTSIGTNTFGNCTNLITITIHKAEDSITGAPWGATNATVTWTG